MDKVLHDTLRDALLNNTYDYDSMHLELKKAWENSFSYLYALQKSYIPYEEHHLKSGEDVSHDDRHLGHLYLNKYLYACFDVNYDLIDVYSREAFRTSEFYQKDFSFMDLVNNPDIFLKMPIIIIDDKVIWDYKIRVSVDTTTFILPFKTSFVLEEYRNETGGQTYKNHKVQVFVVDNSYYKRITLNKSSIHFDPTAQTLHIDSGIVTDIPDKLGLLFCSFHFPDSEGKGYEHGTQLLPLDVSEDGSINAHFTDDINEAIFDSNYDFYVSFVYFERARRHKFYTNRRVTTVGDDNEANLLVLEREDMVPFEMPVPIENIMVMKQKNNDKDFKIVKNTDVLELHYPNIYHIKDPERQEGDRYRIFYFYYEGYDLTYTPLFNFYNQYLKIIFTGSLEEIYDKIFRNKMTYDGMTEEEIKDFQEVFKKIFSYQYYDHQYAEMDFIYNYKTLEENKNKVPFQYKEETLKKWIRVEPHILRDYVLEQNKVGSSYHIWTNRIDLSCRLRTGLSEEFPESGIKFNEDRYVFAFADTRTYPQMLDCRVFVDGIMVQNLIQERNLCVDYIYIPAYMVTEDSYIEMEVFPCYQYETDISFNSIEEEKEIILPEPEETVFPTKYDLYVVDENDDERRYDRDWYDIREIYKEGTFLSRTVDENKPVRFTRLHHFKIQPNDATVINKKMTLHIDKRAKGMEVLITKDGYPYLQFVEKHWNYNIEYLRIYRNGRLLPREKYTFTSSFKCPRILFLDYYHRGDIIYMDITPYRYKEIYYQKDVPEGEGLLVDLKGYITKPFDIRYYDVYMNGRKLSINNVITINPWTISLVNLKSHHNLVIYERERDYEYFGLNYKEHLYYFTLDELFKQSFVKEEDKYVLIKDIIDAEKDENLNIYPNTDEDEEDYVDNRPYALYHIFYFHELLPKRYVNPDRLQFNKELIHDDYPSIYDRYIFKSRDDAVSDYEEKRKHDYPPVIMLDPDISTLGKPPKTNQYIYSVGHLNDDAADYVEDKIEIQNEPNIDKRRADVD